MILAERCAALSLPVRRLLAFGVLPLLAAGAALIVVWPIQQAWLAQQRWRLETQRLLIEAASASARRDALTHQIEAVRASPLHARLYRANGAMNPGASLQGDVDAVMSSMQASSRLLAPIPVSENGSLLRYGVRVSASLRLNQLQEMLNALAQHARLLRVEQLTVIAPQAQGPEENPPLAVSMEIYGYARSDEASAESVTMAPSLGSKQ